MSALLSSWAEEKEYKTGHNEKKEWKSILTNTIRGYILCVVRYGMGVYERGTVLTRVRQVPCRVARNNKQVPCVAANIRFDLSQKNRRDPMENKKDKITEVSEKKEDAAVQELCCCQCSHKTKERSEKEYRDLMNRLKRIEGQVRGIQGMLEKDAYCTDILVQVAAVNAALNSFNRVLLTNHLHTCVAENVRAGNDEVLDELAGVLQKLMK